VLFKNLQNDILIKIFFRKTINPSKAIFGHWPKVFHGSHVNQSVPNTFRYPRIYANTLKE